VDEQDDRERAELNPEEQPRRAAPRPAARQPAHAGVGSASTGGGSDPTVELTDWNEPAFGAASLGDDDTRVGDPVEEGADPQAAFSFEKLEPPTGGARVSTAPRVRAVRAGRRSLHRAKARQTDAIPDAEAREDQESNGSAVEEARRARRRRGGPGSNGRAGGDGPEGRDLVTAVSSGVAIGVVTVILFKLGSTTALVLCSAVVALAAAELFGVLRRAGYRPATLVGLLGAVGLTVGAYLSGAAAYPLVVALVAVFSLLWYLFKVEQARPVVNVAVTLLAFAWVGVLGSFAGLLLDPRLYPNRSGVAFVFGAVIVTVAYDIAAYFTGSRFGRHPLAPSISPAKTWEGLAGGTVAAIVVAAVVVSQIHPWDVRRAIALGVVVAVFAPLGDLCESLLKRDLGLKDMGSLVPGHGGLFDRVDSLLFVLPATYCLLRLLNVA
jgi:CDP-diglyceride synthetase